jgi:transcriptional regulator with XRE-family HTH domain
MNDLDIGGRLRAIRLQHGLSQRQLARRAGIANATVSLIESNGINPSVGALKRILDSIPMGLSEFFALDDTKPQKLFYRQAELTEIGRDGISYRQVGAGLTDRTLQILSERYEPGADTGRILLSHAGEEGAVITRGRLEVFAGDEHAILGPGDAYYFDSTLPHRFRNPGNEVCELVSACTPPSF